MTSALALVLLLGGPARAAAPSLAVETETLRRGDWNERIHAAQQIGDLGAAGLPGLRVAADDADWQVRMTAVHLMGRAGSAAVPDLARVLREEPCRHVRLTALHWLGAIGTPEAEAAIKDGLSDESGMVRLMGRYWLEKGTGRAGQFDPDSEAAAREDVKHCASSAAPGRAPWVAKRGQAAKDEDAGEIDEPVVTPDPTPRASVAAASGAAAAPDRPAPETLAGVPPLPERAGAGKPDASAQPVSRERLRELDSLLAPEEGKPETLAGVRPLPERPAGRAPAPGALSPDARRTPDAKVAAVKGPKPAPESLPPGAPGLPEHPAVSPAAPEIMPDKGAAKPVADPLPVLVKLLRDPAAAKRARAADELGKRGSDAASATPALTAALKDKDVRVRASAALALGNLGPAADASVPALVAALKRGPEEVEWSAAVALGRIGTPRARRAFDRYSRQSVRDFIAEPK